MAERMVRSLSKNEEDKLLLEDVNEIDESERKKTGVAGKRKAEKSSAGNVNPSKSQNSSGKSSRKGSSKPLPENEPDPQPSTSSNSDNVMHNEIMGALKSIREEQKQNRDKLESLSNRIEAIENYEEYEDYEDNPDDFDNDNEVDHEGQDNIEPPQAKKQKVDSQSDNNNNNSRFKTMAKRCKVKEVLDAKIDEVLAESITDLFRNGMDEEEYQELTKDTKNARPENCEGLSMVRINHMIWNILSPRAQTSDKKMQNIQKSIVKAATILTKTVDKLAKQDESNHDDDNAYKTALNSCIESCNDVLALLGHGNRQVNMARREFLKPELMSEYMHLCSTSVPYTTNLFGDDVSKTAKDIEECSKVSNKLRYGRGRGGATFRGGRGYRGYRGGYRGAPRGAGRGRGSMAHYKIPRLTKNYQTGGNSQKDKH